MIIILLYFFTILGVSYETDIQSNTLSTINSIVKFIWDKTLSTPILLESGDIPFTPHLRCDLSSELVNFKELECLLSTSPLRWIIYDQETSHLTFDQIIETGDLFIEWVEKDRQNDLIRAKTCSKISSVDSKISKQINQFLVRKRFDRCGHGGHSQVNYFHYHFSYNKFHLLFLLFNPYKILDLSRFWSNERIIMFTTIKINIKSIKM